MADEDGEVRLEPVGIDVVEIGMQPRVAHVERDRSLGDAVDPLPAAETVVEPSVGAARRREEDEGGEDMSEVRGQTMTHQKPSSRER